MYLFGVALLFEYQRKALENKSEEEEEAAVEPKRARSRGKVVPTLLDRGKWVLYFGGRLVRGTSTSTPKSIATPTAPVLTGATAAEAGTSSIAETVREADEIRVRAVT